MARILVVEDDGALRYDITKRITSWRHEVYQAKDASAGFELIQEVRPDLLLCDICMPGEGGFDLVKRVKENTLDHAHMAIIFISSLADAKAQTYGAHCGADDYIVKPINYAMLDEKITSHLKKSSGLVARLAKLIVKQPSTQPVDDVDLVERRMTGSISRGFGRRKTDA